MVSETNGPETVEEAPGFPLTKEFLELTFEKEVDTFTTKLGTNPGDNYLSIIHAVKVHFHGELEPYHYLIKCYPNHPSRREFLDVMDVFAKELFLYADFLPQLKQLVEKNGAENIATFSTAPFFGGNVVATPSSKYKDTIWAKENFIVMEDLRVSGYSMGDRIQGLNFEQATLVLKQLARLHAATWAYKQENGLRKLSDKYPNVAEIMYFNREVTEQFQSIMDSCSQTSLALIKETLGSDHPACLSIKKVLDQDSMDFIRSCFGIDGVDEYAMEEHLRVKPAKDDNYVIEPWLVGTHGDSWVNNILFRHDHNQKPVATTLVDFQIFREACPTFDLAYFLFSSVRSKIRKPRHDEILQIYYDTFTECCKALHVNTPKGFTFENLKRRWRRAQIFGLLLSMPLLSIVLKPKEESQDLDKAGKDDNMGDMFNSQLEGSDKNTMFKDELISSVLNMYEDGIV